MYWKDEGYLLSKNNFDENSIIIETFTNDHGKYTGIVYGGSSKKQKKNFQIGNKILLNWNSKGENKIGYFSTELIKPISPLFFHSKEKSISILAASSILRLLLPERQINKKIYDSLEEFFNKLAYKNWIKLYILWELSLIKELGFEIDILNKKFNKSLDNKSIIINGKSFKIPKILSEKNIVNVKKSDIRDALIFNRNLLNENFIIPNNLRFPISRNILEKYYT